jgi:predicted nucleic acid-binding Zn ribbon protein
VTPDAEDPQNSIVRGGRPVRLGDILAPALERLGPRGLWTESKLRKVWREVVGESVAAHAEVGRLRNHVLEVRVTSDSWATELTYLAPELLRRLNAKLGPGTVENIVVSRRRQTGR